MTDSFDFFFSLIALVILLVLTFMFSANECHKKYYTFGETRYGVIEGCMVNYKDQWIPSDLIRVEAK